MRMEYTLEFFKKNLFDLSVWYDKNYRKLSPKKRKLWKNILNMVANDMVIDTNKEKGFPIEWRKRYEDNIAKCKESIQELFATTKEGAKK